MGYKTVPRSRGIYASGEMKYFDTSLSTALSAVTTTWVAGTITDPATFLNLCVPTVGAAINQRIGRQIKVHKIKLRGSITIAPQAMDTAADASTTVRLLLVMDKQTNAAQMTAAQLLEDESNGALTIHAFQNLANVGRFQVLKDKKWHFGNLNLAGSPTAGDVIQAGQKVNFKIDHVFRKPIIVNFNTTNGGTIADIVDNSFHVVCGVNDTAFAPSLQYVSRVCYKE